MQTRREFLVQAAAASVMASAGAESAQNGVQKAGRDAFRKPRTCKIPRTDLVVSRIAYGAAMLGIDQRSSDFIAKTISALHTAYDCGVTFFDLADVYGRGQSEVAFGRFLKEVRSQRDGVVIQSKCGIRLPGDWVPGDALDVNNSLLVDLSHDHIVTSVESSLARLDTDHLDILLLHSPDHLIEPEEVARAFSQLHAAGKVRYFGVSNHTVAQIELLRRYVDQPIVANQIQLGLAYYDAMVDRTNYGGLVDYCRLTEVQVQAYSPLRGGGDVTKRPMLLNPPPTAPPEIRRVAQLLVDVGAKHEGTPAAIMIAWLLRHPAEIVPIIGATKTEHIVDSCSADRIVLTAEEWTVLLRAVMSIGDI